jgi:tetratricopeptide (TPR) repeat protein
VNQDFRRSFLETYPNIEEFDATTALEISLAKAKEGVLRMTKPFDNLKLIIEWNGSLNIARNMAAEHNMQWETVNSAQNEFIQAVRNICEDLKNETKNGQAGVYANHIRALGLQYGLERRTQLLERRLDQAQYERSLHDALVDYTLALAERSDIAVEDRMEALAEGAMALLDLRKITTPNTWPEREGLFTSAIDCLWDESQGDVVSHTKSLERQLKAIFLRETIAPELWLGIQLPAVDKQQVPKPYKIALQHYREIVNEALALLESGSLDDQESLQAELVALEAQTWICQLIQDKGIVFSNDYTFEQAAVEKDKLLEIRQRVETNPAQFSNRAYNLIQKARLHESEFYQYQYTPESLNKSIALLTFYIPDVLPPLEEPIPPPEGRFDIRCGVGMLVWKAEAYDQLERFDEAEELFLKILNLYGDRYRYPDPWCFSFKGFAKQYLAGIERKRAQKAELEGGVVR